MSEKDEEEINNQIKVVILGSVGVGKTSLITRYKTRKFLKNIPSTSGSNFVNINKIINNKKYILNIWDTAGQEKFNSLTQTFITNAKIVLLIYSIIDKKSFQDLDTWLNLVKERNGEKGYLLGIAANKSDLYEQSEVSDEEGKKYAKKIKAIWKLTSALKESKGIDELMEELLNNYINYEEKGNNDDVTVTIKLDKSSFSKDNKKEKGCCKNKKNKNENNIRYRSNYSSTSVISKSLSEDNISSEF